MAEIEQTPEAQLSRQGVETLAWNLGKTEVEVGQNVRRLQGLAELLGIRMTTAEQASPTISERATRIAGKLGGLTLRIGKRSEEIGRRMIESAEEYEKRRADSQAVETEKELDEKAKLAREAQIKATGEREVSERVVNKTDIQKRESYIQEGVRRLK